VDFRGYFLIDPDGVIQAMEVLTPPVGRQAILDPTAQTRLEPGFA
jgi:alkyl hydroperoxide reductase subunit AhpC